MSHLWFCLIAVLTIGMMSLLSAPTVARGGDSELAFPKTEEEITRAFEKQEVRTRGLRTRGIRGVAAVVEDRKVGAMIYFDLNSAVIKPESYNLLDEFGKAFSRGLKDEQFVVAGHTDATGSDDYNYHLSLKRAQAVANYLIGHHNLDASRFFIEGYGEQQPIADNNTAYGRSRNRRVEFICK